MVTVLSDEDRAMVQRVVEHMEGIAHELARLDLQLSMVTRGDDRAPAVTVSHVTERMGVLRARAGASEQILTELLERDRRARLAAVKL